MKAITTLQRIFTRKRTLRRTLATLRLDADAGSITSEHSKHTFQTIIGLEVHAQLDIPTKLFSNAPSKASNAPNTDIMPFDLAVPGFLPQLSKQAVQAAVLAAAALNCDIQTTSRFERKHYAYADLPLGYQITQQRWPVARHGNIRLEDEGNTVCRINRIQLETDTAKTTMHQQKGKTDIVSRVDFSRAGNALIEIVMEPDLSTPRQAAAAVTGLRQLLRYAGVCDGRMNEGSLRVDLNVNLAYRDEHGATGRTPRVEVKNLNSVQQVHDAAVYEVLRQANAIINQESMVMETRTWNVLNKQTLLIRRKDQADDYRFLPDPDLPPLVIDETTFDGESLESFLKARLPELPAAAIRRLRDQYGLTEYQARVIANDPPAIRFFDNALQESKSADIVVNLLINDLFGLVKEHHVDHEEEEPSMANCPLQGRQLGILASMLQEEGISSTQSKKLLRLLYEDSPEKDPRDLAREKGFELITDTEALRQLVESVVDSHPNELDVYRKGGKYMTKMTKLFTGKAMSASRGNAHPERLVEIVHEVLKKKA